MQGTGYWTMGLAVLALALVPYVAAQQGEQVTLEVEAHDEGAEYWFTVEGLDGRNPTITIPPGAQVTVNLVNAGMQPHNIHFGAGIDQASDILTAGGETSITFTAPTEETEDNYWCDPHRAQGMEGALRIGSAEAPPGDGADGGDEPPEEATPDTPGLGAAFVLAALGAAAALATRRRG